MKELIITIIYRDGKKEKHRVHGLAPDITEAEIAEMGQKLTKIFCPEWSKPSIRSIEMLIREKAPRENKKANKGPSRTKKKTVKEVKLPSVGQMTGWSPKTAAKHQLRYIKEDLSDKKRINDTLINIQIEEAFCSSDLLLEKKPLTRESHQEILSLIFNRENWTAQMLAAFHQLKHLLRSNEKNRLRRNIKSMNWRLRNEFLSTPEMAEDSLRQEDIEVIVTTQEIITPVDMSLTSVS